MLEYKGYTGKITAFDEQQGIINGRVMSIRDLITFQGKTSDELIQAFRDSVDDYLQWCNELGEPPQTPYSGRVSVRMSPELHRQIEQASERAEMTMDSWIVAVLTDFLQRNFLNGHPRAIAP